MNQTHKDLTDADRYVLGINGGVRPGYQDLSAVLLKGTKVVAAIEEERLNRIKHCAGQLPIKAIQEVLSIAQIDIEDVAAVGFHGSTWHDGIDLVLQKHFENYLGFAPLFYRFHHHLCHAASAYYPSGLNNALILTIDGSGDGVSTQIAVGKGSEIEVISTHDRPQSLGFFYSIITQLCGFTRDADEYKLMGLSAYGNANQYNLDDILAIDENGYHFDLSFMEEITAGQPAPSRFEILYSKKLIEKFKVSRRHQKSISQTYKDIAAAAQAQLEKAIISIVKKYVKQTGIHDVCLSGGVALNCLANQKIEQLPEVNQLFIQPAANDAGISLGAAYLTNQKIGVKNFEPQQHSFLGNAFTDIEIESVFKHCELTYKHSSDLITDAAQLLAHDKVIGWFQGRMEFGPRALGNRSILANPSSPDIQKKINQKIKFRESFRPFGATVLLEDFHTYFEAKCTEAPYMTKVFFVKKEYQEQLKGIIHVDGTCRVQTINEAQNEKYYKLIQSFKKITGYGVLLNTSFNLSHEPIVAHPREAIASFYASGLDTLIIGNFIVHKK